MLNGFLSQNSCPSGQAGVLPVFSINLKLLQRFFFIFHQVISYFLRSKFQKVSLPFSLLCPGWNIEHRFFLINKLLFYSGRPTRFSKSLNLGSERRLSKATLFFRYVSCSSCSVYAFSSHSKTFSLSPSSQ